MGSGRARYRFALTFIVPGLVAAAVLASLLPLVPTNVWWVRFFDFPRLQVAIALLVLLPPCVILRPRGSIGWMVVCAGVMALGHQLSKLYPYSRLAEPAAVADPHCAAGDALRIMSANVKRRNESAEVFLEQVAAVNPDLLLVMETDAWWDKRLSVLADNFPYRIQKIPDHHAFYGMHLFSKLDLVSAEFRLLFDADTPTAVAQVRLPGGAIVNVIGLHPRPPHPWSQPTTMRDAHILAAAMIAREADAPTLLAGDFNAFPWESVTRRAIRVGGLLDPRIGRGLYPTYDTRSFLMSWPLDQILFHPQFTLQNFQTLPDFGSDHLAVVANLCHHRSAQQDAPLLRDDDLAQADLSIRLAKQAE